MSTKTNRPDNRKRREHCGNLMLHNLENSLQYRVQCCAKRWTIEEMWFTMVDGCECGLKSFVPVMFQSKYCKMKTWCDFAVTWYFLFCYTLCVSAHLKTDCTLSITYYSVCIRPIIIKQFFVFEIKFFRIECQLINSFYLYKSL